MAGDDNFDSIRLRCSGVELEQWPKLSCSEVGILDFDLSNLRLDGDRSLQFQGNGQIRTAGSLRVFTNGGTEKLTLLANGNVGISNSAPTTQLEVTGAIKADALQVTNAVKASSFLGDGSGLDGVVKKAGDTMTGALTVSGIVKADVFEGKFSGDGSALTNLPVAASQWQTNGSNISFNAGSVGIGTTNPQANLHVVGTLLGAAKGSMGEALRIAVGTTPPGATNWIQYGEHGIYVDIDISSAGFSNVPYCFTSIGGVGYHWTTQGATSIYSPTATSFRVYVYAVATTVALANERQWHIQWLAVGN